MNEHIKDAIRRAKGISYDEDGNELMPILAGENIYTFARILVQDCVNELRQEWYVLNDLKPNPDETPRDIGLRVGRKSELIYAIHLLSERYDL